MINRVCIVSMVVFVATCGRAFAIKPKSDYINTPKDFGISYKETVVTSQTASLVTWYMSNSQRPKAATIIMANSDYGNMSYLLRTASEFYRAGFNVVLFDYRGFGHSSHFEIDSNRLYYDEFVDDLVAVYKIFSATSRGPIFVYGQSMGTIIATIAMTKNKEITNSKFIFESFIENLDNAILVLKKLKARDFTVPPSHANYDNYVQMLKKRSGLIFIGSDDVIASSGSIDYKSTKWSMVPYAGGHLAAPYVLKANFFNIVTKYALLR